MAISLLDIIGTITGKLAFERTQANFTTLKTEVNSHGTQINTLADFVNYNTGRILYYSLGDECIDLTGGWTVLIGTASKGLNYLKLYTSSDPAAIVTVNKIDLTNINTLNIECKYDITTNATDTSFEVMLVDVQSSYAFVTEVKITKSMARDILTIDVSSVSGTYYIKGVVSMATFGKALNAEIYRVWGE